MSRILHWVQVTIIVVLSCSFSGAAQGVVETFRMSMQRHDAGDLARFFDNTVDITYEHTQSVYSKTQARMILNDFYTRYNPQNFEVEYNSRSQANDAQYIIGTANTAKGKFKVFFFIRLRGKRQVIREMKILR